MPTDTGSTWIGPTRSSSPAITASKIGRSKGGPVEKYSSSVIAGEHSWPCPLRANCRWHFGHTQIGTTESLPGPS